MTTLTTPNNSAEVRQEYRGIGYDEARAMPSHLVRDRLAHDYDILASMYAELADELADEVWVPVENAALLQTEGLGQSASLPSALRGENNEMPRAE
ncbi:MAG: hypothetical protein K1X65_09650 [Caldilineales bacterium]|nr:hypothetical protein [Caldilineales bacterium]